jgi:hypothetical protein
MDVVVGGQYDITQLPQLAAPTGPGAPSGSAATGAGLTPTRR